MIKGLYILNEGAFKVIYGEPEKKDIAKYVEMVGEAQTPVTIKERPELLSEIEVIFSGWGAPKMDADFLGKAPGLKAVFYGAGSVKGFVSDAFWERDILLTSAYGANGVPVAEYTLSQILFCLKHGWQYAMAIKREGKYPPRTQAPGGYQSTVGLVSLGMIGRLVCDMLKNFDLNVIAYDPFVKQQEADELGLQLVSLDEVFERSDVVSLHTPWLKETEKMIQGRHFAMMKPGATFINTARGAVVDEPEMIKVLQQREDLFVVLDVTYPEPPKPESPLYTLPNVILTPHIAGSMHNECRRMGRYMVEELERYVKGEPFKWLITKEKAAVLA